MGLAAKTIVSPEALLKATIGAFAHLPVIAIHRPPGPVRPKFLEFIRISS